MFVRLIEIAAPRLPIAGWSLDTYPQTANELFGFRFPVSAAISATGDRLRPPDAKI
jgi:hypothetical protein